MSFEGITRAALEATSGAAKIGITAISGVTGTNVQAALSSLKTLIDGKAASSHPHSGADITSGTVSVDRIGTGTKDSTTYYRGDGTFAVPSGGGAAPFSDATALVKDDADATKLVRVDAGTVATGTTRVLTMPNSDVNLGVMTPNTRTISTTAPLTGGGDLSANRTLAISAATTSDPGSMSAADKTRLDGLVAYETVYWTFDGDLVVTTGVFKVPITKTGTIDKVWAVAGTAPTGSTAIFDINYDGTTIWSTQGNRITIPISSTSMITTTTFNTTAVVEDHYLTCDIDQKGSTISGANVTVALRYRYTL